MLHVGDKFFPRENSFKWLNNMSFTTKSKNSTDKNSTECSLVKPSMLVANAQKTNGRTGSAIQHYLDIIIYHTFGNDILA